MSMDELTVRRFQSLHDVTLPLGKLTVIVGPSNSGKSALGRAMRTVTRNTAGSSFVTHGHKTSLLQLSVDGNKVILERGPGHSVYKAVINGKDETYVKSGKEVPEDLQALLNLPPIEGVDIHLTTQFDGPFLLAEAGAKVSTIIGSLTNVTLLAEAAREANRRRLEAQRLATQRRKDAEAAKLTIKERYASLPARQAAVQEARTLFNDVHDQLTTANRLADAGDRALTARDARERAEAQAAMLKAQLEAVDLAPVEQAAQNYATLRTALLTFATAKKERLAAQKALDGAREELTSAEKAFEDKMKEHPACPLCNQPLS